nr:hypothetical protein [Tanacetum cinerariifolium]
MSVDNMVAEDTHVHRTDMSVDSMVAEDTYVQGTNMSVDSMVAEDTHVHGSDMSVDSYDHTHMDMMVEDCMQTPTGETFVASPLFSFDSGTQPSFSRYALHQDWWPEWVRETPRSVKVATMSAAKASFILNESSSGRHIKQTFWVKVEGDLAYDVRAMLYVADLPRDLGVVNLFSKPMEPFAVLGKFLLRYYASLNLVSVLPYKAWKPCRPLPAQQKVTKNEINLTASGYKNDNKKLINNFGQQVRFFVPECRNASPSELSISGCDGGQVGVKCRRQGQRKRAKADENARIRTKAHENVRKRKKSCGNIRKRAKMYKPEQKRMKAYENVKKRTKTCESRRKRDENVRKLEKTRESWRNVRKLAKRAKAGKNAQKPTKTRESRPKHTKAEEYARIRTKASEKDGGLDVCVDLTGSSPLTQTGMVDFVLGQAVIDAAQRKRAKYMAKLQKRM